MSVPKNLGDNSLLSAALSYVRRRWHIIPLHNLINDHCTCERGKECPPQTRGKHPRFTDWPSAATCDEKTIKGWWRKWPKANIGVVTGSKSGIAVIDIDPRNGGNEDLKDLEQCYSSFPETPMVLSGGGGQHFYFACSESLPSVKLAHGIDFLADGNHQAVLPPSLHLSGRRYEWEITYDIADIPLTPLPEWVVALVHDKSVEYTADIDILPDTLPHVEVHDLKLSHRMKYLIRTGADPDNPHRYPSRSEAVFAVINEMLHHDHDAATIVSVLMDTRNGISEKPLEQRNTKNPRYLDQTKTWILGEIQRAKSKRIPRAREVYDGRSRAQPGAAGRDVYNGHAAGHPPSDAAGHPPSDAAGHPPSDAAGHPPSDAAGRDPILQPWRLSLLTKKNGEPTSNVANIGLILANHPEWHDKFWLDAVRGIPMIEEQPLSDECIVHIGQWLGVQERLAISNLRPLEQCIIALCKQNPKDLLQIWLNTLPPWDKVSRLDAWLSDVASCQRDEYGMAVSRILPLSMIARAMDPGCLYRYVVILEGPENTGKSSLVRELAGEEWYVELAMGLENKESHMMLQGAWVVEMAELDSLTRTEETRLKAFITMKQDVWIPKYSNLKVSTPRRTIFIGTTNDESYLKGQTGNTRFLPIKTGDIDLLGFQAMREQIFAEALQVYHANPQAWWQLSEEAMQQAADERENRRVENVYEDGLQEWLAGQKEVTWQDIALRYLHLEPAGWKDKSLQMQIAQALKAMGWKRTVVKDSNGKSKRLWVYHKGGSN